MICGRRVVVGAAGVIEIASERVREADALVCEERGELKVVMR